MNETKQCPYCGEEILATAKKCKHCGEWLTEEARGESRNANGSTGNVGMRTRGPLLVPRGSKFWGWFAGIMMWRSLMILLRHEVPYVDYVGVMGDLMLAWGFQLFVTYCMGNFKQEIPLLKLLPWCFFGSVVLGIVAEANVELSVESWVLWMVLNIGIIVFILYIAKHLMKLSGDLIGGVKSLGAFMFFAHLIYVVSLLIDLLFFVINEMEEGELMPDWVWNWWYFVVSLVTYILLLRVFRKARRYNKQFLGGGNGIDGNGVKVGEVEVQAEGTAEVLEQGSAEQGKVREGKRGLSKRGIGILAGVFGLIVIGVVLWVSLGSREAKYYLCVGENWQPSKNYSHNVAIVSNAEEDAYPLESEWHGDLTVAVSGGAGTKITPVLSSFEVSCSQEFRDIVNQNPEEISGFIRAIYPSSRLEDVVYFNFHPSSDSEPFSVYGKVDVRTGKFALYTGTFWGIITKGSYADCYLCERDGLMHIFPQSGIGESSGPVEKFKLSDYIRYDEYDLYKLEFRGEVIEWLEKQ